MRRAAAEQSDEGQDGVDDGIRSCALTRARRPKDELIRFVLGPDGAVVPDLKEKLPGRGVWVTAAYDTVAKAAKRNVFARALKTEAKVPEDLAGQVDRLPSSTPRKPRKMVAASLTARPRDCAREARFPPFARSARTN